MATLKDYLISGKFDGEVSINGMNMTLKDMLISAKLSGGGGADIVYEASNLTFNGSNCIDTGVKLFSEENINKDFKVTVTGAYFANGGTSAATMLCNKKNSNSYGFLVRPTDKYNDRYAGTYFILPDSKRSFVIERKNGVITKSGDIVNNPPTPINSVHDEPLVLGCAINDSGAYYRYATGTIDKIVIEIAQ